MAAALRARRERSHRLPCALAAGALGGAAALTRPAGLVVLPALALAALPQARPGRARLAAAAVVLAGVAVVSPWTARNAHVLHAFVPVSTEAGNTLAGTYNPVAARDPILPWGWQDPRATGLYRAERTAHRFDEPATDAALRAAALRYVAAHPAAPLEVALHDGARLAGLAPRAWSRRSLGSVSLVVGGAVQDLLRAGLLADHPARRRRGGRRTPAGPAGRVVAGGRAGPRRGRARQRRGALRGARAALAPGARRARPGDARTTGCARPGRPGPPGGRRAAPQSIAGASPAPGRPRRRPAAARGRPPGRVGRVEESLAGLADADARLGRPFPLPAAALPLPRLGRRAGRGRRRRGRLVARRHASRDARTPGPPRRARAAGGARDGLGRRGARRRAGTRGAGHAAHRGARRGRAVPAAGPRADLVGRRPAPAPDRARAPGRSTTCSRSRARCEATG